jgi:hypothetical protein
MLGLLLYLAAVTWAVIESGKRWMTLLWIVVSFAAVLAVLLLCSQIWPFEAGVLGHHRYACRHADIRSRWNLLYAGTPPSHGS